MMEVQWFMWYLLPLLTEIRLGICVRLHSLHTPIMLDCKIGRQLLDISCCCIIFLVSWYWSQPLQIVQVTLKPSLCMNFAVVSLKKCYLMWCEVYWRKNIHVPLPLNSSLLPLIYIKASSCWERKNLLGPWLWKMYPFLLDIDHTPLLFVHLCWLQVSLNPSDYRSMQSLKCSRSLVDVLITICSLGDVVHIAYESLESC